MSVRSANYDELAAEIRAELDPTHDEIARPDEVADPTDTQMFERVDRGPHSSHSPYRFDEKSREVVLEADAVLLNANSVESEIDAILDGKNRPVEKFMAELEVKLLRGEPKFRVRTWARREHGINSTDFARFEGVLRATWRLEGTTYFVMQQQRDELRQMYLEIYRESLQKASEEPKLMQVALNAIEAISKLYGLVGPNVAVQINTGPMADMTKDQLTNKTREQTMILLQKMKERAELRSQKMTEKLMPARIPTMEELNAEGVIIEKLDELEAPSPRVMGVVR